MAVDVAFGSVALLLDGDGTNGSVSVVDSGPLALTGTAFGSAAISTVEKKWGTGSFAFDGSGDYLSFAANSAFAPWSGPFTAEAWVHLGSGNNIGDRVVFIGRTTGDLSFGLTSGKLQFGPKGIGYDVTSAATVPTGSWVHVAACHDGTTLRLFIGGTMDGNAVIARTYNAAGAFDVGGSALDVNLSINGYVDDARLTIGVARYTANFTPPAAPFSSDRGGYASAGGPLTAPALVLGVSLVSSLGSAASPLSAERVLAVQITPGQISAPSPLAGGSVLALHDFTVLVVGSTSFYMMDLTSPGGVVRVPISSWQATLRGEEPSYVQCVVPGAADWVDVLSVSTSFEIIRQASAQDGSEVRAVIAAAPLDVLSLAQGGFNYSATLSGYSEAINDSESIVRVLDKVRTTFTYPAGYRVRCAIDWLLRPGHTATFGGGSFQVRYISYYVQGNDAFMDVGQ